MPIIINIAELEGDDFNFIQECLRCRTIFRPVKNPLTKYCSEKCSQSVRTAKFKEKKQYQNA